MRITFRRASILCALFLAVAAAAFAAEAPQAPNRFASAPAPAERFEVQGMLVERHGSGGRALILIPGLATGGWVWQETVREFAGGHTVYVVTLAGFDGRPPVEGNPFDAARGALKELIAARRLANPVLVGHSLGATLAIALAGELPGPIGGAVAIDGLPVMPRTEDTPPEQRAAMAESMRQRMAAANSAEKPAAFAARQRQTMRAVGTVDMGKADDLARLTSRSDPAAVAAWVGAVLALEDRGARAGTGALLRPGQPRPRRDIRDGQGSVLSGTDERHPAAGGRADRQCAPLRHDRPAASGQCRVAPVPENPVRRASCHRAFHPSPTGSSST
jgi:pimeloyl-ACP methyl ester carboxylesterase